MNSNTMKVFSNELIKIAKKGNTKFVEYSSKSLGYDVRTEKEKLDKYVKSASHPAIRKVIMRALKKVIR